MGGVFCWVGWDKFHGLGGWKLSHLREDVGFGAVGLFWGCGHRMRGVDLLGGVVSCMDWVAEDRCIYGRMWDQRSGFGGSGLYDFFSSCE